MARNDELGASTTIWIICLIVFVLVLSIAFFAVLIHFAFVPSKPLSIVGVDNALDFPPPTRTDFGSNRATYSAPASSSDPSAGAFYDASTGMTAPDRTMERDKIVQVHWNGRFGNRLFQYAFGCQYARRHGLMYYRPSEWEGSVLFAPCEYSRVVPDDALRQKLNQTAKELDTREYRSSAIAEYNRRTGDRLELVDFSSSNVLGKRNVAFDDLSSMYSPHNFDLMERDFVRYVYRFSDDVVASPMYQHFLRHKGTYDVAHVRRGDIDMKDYEGGHSVVTVDSYLRAMRERGYDPDSVVWISDDKTLRRNDAWFRDWQDKTKGGWWSYPVGERKMKDVFFDFFPDFLAICFARTIFRANSSFSWWAAHLSDALIFSPVVPSKPPELHNRRCVVDCAFVEGNHPHFMGSVDEGYHDVTF